jgi:hypothetical protein
MTRRRSRSVMPMIWIAGFLGLAAMTALLTLGWRLNSSTQRLGIHSTITIGPDGKLSAPVWRQADNAAGPAPPGYYDVGNSIYSALQQRVSGGRIDPSWLQPGAGIFIEYGSDEDRGLDHPQANIRFRSGYITPIHVGSEQTITGGDPIDIWWVANDYHDLLRRLAADPYLPLFSAAPVRPPFRTIGSESAPSSAP